jgi:putative endonuclease
LIAPISAQTRHIEPLTPHPDAATLHSMQTPPDRSDLGSAAEARAASVLERAGFTVLERNYRCRAGELDIVARRERMLVIAEVRLRTGAAFGGAAASITAAKRTRIVRATRYLLRCQPSLAALYVRFDVMLLSAADGPIEWIEGAFEAG